MQLAFGGRDDSKHNDTENEDRNHIPCLGKWSFNNDLLDFPSQNWLAIKVLSVLTKRNPGIYRELTIVSRNTLRWSCKGWALIDFTKEMLSHCSNLYSKWGRSCPKTSNSLGSFNLLPVHEFFKTKVYIGSFTTQNTLAFWEVSLAVDFSRFPGLWKRCTCFTVSHSVILMFRWPALDMSAQVPQQCCSSYPNSVFTGNSSSLMDNKIQRLCIKNQKGLQICWLLCQKIGTHPGHQGYFLCYSAAPPIYF